MISLGRAGIILDCLLDLVRDARAAGADLSHPFGAKVMFKWTKKSVLAAALLAGTSLAALAAGLYTNGLPTPRPSTENTTVLTPPSGVVNEIYPTSSVGLPNLGTPRLPVDTNLPSGANPQTVAADPFQVAAVLAGALGNTASSSAAAATLNTLSGIISSDYLSTAVGSTVTFTLTNSNIAAADPAPLVAAMPKASTGCWLAPTSVVNASGSTVMVFTNLGPGACNGTFSIAFHVRK